MSKTDGPLSGLAGLGRVSGSGGRSRRRRSRGRHSHDPGVALASLGAVVPVLLLVLVLAGVYVLVQFLRGGPAVTVQAGRAEVRVAGSLSPLPWPTQGSAALAVDGVGTVGRSGTTTPLPIASVTKVMTALLVLQDHPLSPGQQGPAITITAADVAQYNADVATQQSVVQVATGEQITELQALEGLLVPSGNNLADVLAAWDAGSVPAFVAKMNAEAAHLGLHHTHYVSPTGLESGSVSTPTDLIALAEVAMHNPVFASIVAMPSVTLPVAGNLFNYDYNVGHNGFVGIKTGSDGQAGGCFVFEAKVPAAGGTTVPVVGAVLGQQATPIIQSALNAATSLVQALGPQIGTHQLVRTGQPVGRITTPWGAGATVVAASGVTGTGWPGLVVPTTFVPVRHLGSSVRKGERVGTLKVVVGSTTQAVPVVAGAAVSGPGLGWEVTNL